MGIAEELTKRAESLMDELRDIGEFRRGSVGTYFRKCGKKGCGCHKGRHPGHPQTKLTVKEEGKTKSTHLPSTETLRVVTEQIRNHDRFVQWCKQWTELNERISDLTLKEALCGRDYQEDSPEKKLLRWSLRRSARR